MRHLLQILPGRVLHCAPPHLIVEFPPDDQPRPNAILQSPRGALVEIAGHLNPTESLGILRRGPCPAPDDRLTPHPDLVLPTTDALWGQTLTPCRAPSPPPADLPSAALAIPRQIAPPPDLQPAGQWPLGHPGLDLLAPLMAGCTLTLIGDDPAALAAVAAAHLPHAARMADARLLWISGRPLGALPPDLDPARAVHLRLGEGPGEAALLLRAALALAEDASARGHRLLVVLDDPIDALLAWKLTEARGAALAAPMALQHLQDALAALSRHPQRALVALFHDDPLRLGQLAPRFDPAAYFDAAACFEGRRLLPLEARTSLTPHLDDDLRRAAERCRALLVPLTALDDHASVFGEDELDDHLRDDLGRQRRLLDLLSSPPERPTDLTSLAELGL